MRTIELFRLFLCKMICPYIIMSVCLGCAVDIRADDILDSEFSTVENLRGSFADIKQGHGPYLWLQKNSAEYWFWYVPTREDEDISNFKIGFVSKIINSDENQQQVIWPKEFEGKELKQVYEDTYKHLRE